MTKNNFLAIFLRLEEFSMGLHCEVWLPLSAAHLFLFPFNATVLRIHRAADLLTATNRCMRGGLHWRKRYSPRRSITLITVAVLTGLSRYKVCEKWIRKLTRLFFEYSMFLDLLPNMERRLCFTGKIPVRFRAGKGHLSNSASAFYLP